MLAGGRSPSSLKGGEFMKRTICVTAEIGLMLAIGVSVMAAETAKYHEIKKIAVGGEGGWDYLTCDGANHRLYISRGTHVSVVDLEKGEVVGDIPNTTG